MHDDTMFMNESVTARRWLCTMRSMPPIEIPAPTSSYIAKAPAARE